MFIDIELFMISNEKCDVEFIFSVGLLMLWLNGLKSWLMCIVGFAQNGKYVKVMGISHSVVVQVPPSCSPRNPVSRGKG